MPPRVSLKGLLAVTYLLILTAAVYNTALLPDRTILPADLLLLTPPWKYHSQDLLAGFHAVARPAWDPLFQFYPARSFLATSIRHGTVPLWNPNFFSGTPFAADDQSAVFYPFNWLFATLPLAPAFAWLAALHTFLAGLFMTMFGRRIGWGWSAALTAATAWMLCGVLVVWQMWQVIDAAACWLPLALYFWEGWRRRHDRRQLAGLAAAIGLSALAGHLQFTAYVMMTVFGYGVFRAFDTDGTEHYDRPAKSIAALVLSMLLGVGIAAVQLSATADYLPHTNRTLQTYKALIGTAMPPSQLLMLVAPDIFGGQRDMQLGRLAHPFIGLHSQPDYYELTCFCGAAALVFAMFGVRWLKTADPVRPRTLFWLGVAIFALLMGCGTPLYALFYYALPLFKSFHGPARIFILFDFAIAILAAEGVQRLASTDSTERRQVAMRVFGGVFIAILIGLRFAVTNTTQTVAFVLVHAEPDGWLTHTLTQLGVAIGAALVAALLLAFGPRRAANAAVIIVAIESLLFAVGVNSSMPANLLYPQTPETQYVSSNLGDDRVWCLGDGNPSNFQSKLVPNSAMSLGWRDVAGSDPFEMKTYVPISTMLDQAQATAPPAGQDGSVAPVRSTLDRLDVKLIVTPRPLSDPDLKLDDSGDIYVYENLNAFGVGRLIDGHGSSTSLTVTSYRPDMIQFADTAGTSGDLSTSIVYDPGWKAYVDGQLTPTGSDGIYLRVPVAQAAHSIVLRYQPGSVRAGLFISMISLLILSGICFCKPSNN